MPETDPPAPEIEAAEGRGRRRGASQPVWLVPLLALLRRARRRLAHLFRARPD